MKKVTIIICIISIISIVPFQKVQAQLAIADIIKAGVKKVIRAIDLKIQRLQNKTIWLQNAQKVVENQLSKLKLAEIGDWAKKQKELYGNYFDELWKIKNSISCYRAVKDIIAQQVQIVQEYSKAFRLSRQDKNFNASELAYMQKVYGGILEESLKNSTANINTIFEFRNYQKIIFNYYVLWY